MTLATALVFQVESSAGNMIARHILQFVNECDGNMIARHILQIVNDSAMVM